MARLAASASRWASWAWARASSAAARRREQVLLLDLHLLDVLDVGAGAEPAGDPAGRVADGQAADQVPAVGAVRPPGGTAARCRTAARWRRRRTTRRPPGPARRGAAPAPSWPARPGPGRARVVVPAAVVVVDRPVRAGAPDDLRHGVGQLAEAGLAGPQGVGGAARSAVTSATVPTSRSHRRSAPPPVPTPATNDASPVARSHRTDPSASTTRYSSASGRAASGSMAAATAASTPARSSGWMASTARS